MPRAGITYFRTVPTMRTNAAIAKMIHAERVPVIHDHTRIAPPTTGAEGQICTTAPITPMRMTMPTMTVPRMLMGRS